MQSVIKVRIELEDLKHALTNMGQKTPESIEDFSVNASWWVNELIDRVNKMGGAEQNPSANVGSTGDEAVEGKGQQDGDGCYYDLTVQLLNLRNEIFAGAGMTKDCFTETYLNGLGDYEREVAKKEGIDIGW